MTNRTNAIVSMLLAASSFGASAIERNGQGYDFLIAPRISYMQNELNGESDDSDAYGIEFIYSERFEYRPKLSAGVNMTLDVGDIYHSASGQDIEIEAWALAPFLSYRLIDGLDIYGKVGIANWSYELKSRVNASGVDPVYGAGVRYNFWNRVYLGLEWQYIQMEDKGMDLDTQFTTASMGYRF